MATLLNAGGDNYLVVNMAGKVSNMATLLNADSYDYLIKVAVNLINMATLLNAGGDNYLVVNVAETLGNYLSPLLTPEKNAEISQNKF